MSGPDHADTAGSGIDHRSLRSAIEYAVSIAEETQKRKPPMAVPRELRPFFGTKRIPSAALGRLRRAIEADDVFRSRIARGALPELVDEVGRLWLQRPENWAADASGLVAQRAEQSAELDARAALRRAERRREAAEESAVRSRAEVVRLAALIEEQRAEIEGLRAGLREVTDALADTRSEVVEARTTARHARDREVAATAKLDAVLAQGAPAALPDTDAHAAPGPGPAHPPSEANPVRPAAAELREIVELARSTAAAATDAADRIEELAQLPSSGGAAAGPPARRRRLGLPGGVIASSAAAASFLLRSGAAVFVDGYNVAMLAWPRLTLAEQRTALLDALENLALRSGADITVVFDGADVVGAHGARRRSTRVVYSPSGVSADDVIRSEVRTLPSERHAVVVTNDAEIARDVRALGANVVPSNALIAVF